MNKLENKNRQNRVPLSPLKSANLLDINELADSPLKTGHIWGSNFLLCTTRLGSGVRGNALYIICVTGYAPEYIIHIHFHRKTVPGKRFR